MSYQSVLGNYKIFKSMRASIDSILVDSMEFLSNRFNQSKTVFTAASPFGQLLIVTENISQLILYYIEDAITELNINEASRITSVYSLAALAGHNPSRSMSAVGSIDLSINIDAEDFPADFVIIPNLTKLTCANNGLTYVLDLPQDEIKYSLTGKDNNLELNIRQGILETQTVVSQGRELESFSIGNSQSFFIDQYFVNVYVNGEKWKKYESILDMPRGEDAYLVKTGITGGLDLYFGNKSFGSIPPIGAEIIIEYLINEGPRGNIRTNDQSQIRFKFDDTGFTVLGDEVELNDFINISVNTAPFFGVNPESSDLTRLIAPHKSKSFALINEDHYDVTLRKLNMFSLINVYLDELDNRMLNIFLVPDIRKIFKKSQDYFGADLDRFILSDKYKAEVVRYLEKSGSKLVSTDIKMIDPLITKYVINLTVIVFDDVPVELIRNDIYTKISDYFISNVRRNRIPKSDLIKLIEEVKGVDSVAIKIIGENNERVKKVNANAPLQGLDDFNDIIIKNNELPIIRGGFTDVHGNEYAIGLSNDALGSVNISINDIVRRPVMK